MKLTNFQSRVLDAIERGPNRMANTWEIALNGFSEEWIAKRAGHGALIRNIINAGVAMKKKGILVILPPRDEHDTYTFCSHRAAEQPHGADSTDAAPKANTH